MILITPFFPTTIKSFKILPPKSEETFKYEKKKHVEHILFIWPQFILSFAMIIGYIVYGLSTERIHESMFTTVITLIMFSTFIVNMCLTFRTYGTDEFIITIINEFYKGED